MTKTQEAFFAMALKVKNFGAKNAATIATNTPLTALFAQLGDLIMQLIAADGGARLNISGITIDKANKRKLLENLTLKFFNAIESYSVLANETGLRKKVRFPASKWYSCSEEELVMQASIAKNLATPLLPILVDYGVAAAH